MEGRACLEYKHTFTPFTNFFALFDIFFLLSQSPKLDGTHSLMVSEPPFGLPYRVKVSNFCMCCYLRGCCCCPCPPWCIRKHRFQKHRIGFYYPKLFFLELDSNQNNCNIPQRKDTLLRLRTKDFCSSAQESSKILCLSKFHDQL